MGGKGDRCWKNHLIRRKGVDSVPGWVAGFAQERGQPSCRKQRAGGQAGVWPGSWEQVAGLVARIVGAG